MGELDVVVGVCWGCNAQLWPSEWRGWEAVLLTEGRVRWVETLCGHRLPG